MPFYHVIIPSSFLYRGLVQQFHYNTFRCMIWPLDEMPISLMSASERSSNLRPVIWLFLKTSAQRCISHSGPPATKQPQTHIHQEILLVPPLLLTGTHEHIGSISETKINNLMRTSYPSQKSVTSRSAVKWRTFQ